MNVKGKGQRLIPEELLKYLEALKNKYPDAVDLVEANPTLEGGEDSLSSVLINGTKYAVGGGSDLKLYLHRITLPYNSTNNHLSFVVISQKDSAYTYTEILAWLESLGTGAGWQGGVPVSTTDVGTTNFPTGVGYNNDGFIRVFYWNGSQTISENLTNYGMTIYDNYIEV